MLTDSTKEAAVETAWENAITTEGTVAVLPPCLLWAAGMAASTDLYKGVLCSIDVRRTQDGHIRITSVDGHRLFKVIFPQSEHFFISDEQTEPFQLNPKAFTKPGSKKTLTVSIQSGGLAQFANERGEPVDAAVWNGIKEASVVGQKFPEIDKLIPDEKQLTCKPGQAVAFNSRYVGDFCKIAERLSRNSVIQYLTTDSAMAPFILKTELDGSWLLSEKGVMMYYLIMPVAFHSENRA
jgi:hypothetical protein